MARMPLLNPEGAPDNVREVFDRYIRVRGNIPNMFRTLAVRPEIMITLEAHMAAVINKGTVSVALKEIGAVRTSVNNHCEY